MGDGVEDACWEAGIVEARDDGPGAARGNLGGFDDGGVAGGKGISDGADAEDVGGVPGAGLVAGRKRAVCQRLGRG